MINLQMPILSPELDVLPEARMTSLPPVCVLYLHVNMLVVALHTE